MNGQARRDEVCQGSCRVARRDFMHPEQRPGVIFPVPLSQGAPVLQQRGALHEEYRKGTQPLIDRCVAVVLALPGVDKRLESVAYTFCDVAHGQGQAPTANIPPRDVSRLSPQQTRQGWQAWPSTQRCPLCPRTYPLWFGTGAALQRTCPLWFGTGAALHNPLLRCQKTGAAASGTGAALHNPLLPTLRPCPNTRNTLLRFHSTRTRLGNPCP
jgi:hypothetical protein